MTTRAQIKAAQCTTKIAQDRRDLMNRVLLYAGLDPTGMKFSVVERDVAPCAVGDKVTIPAGLTMYHFISSLVHEAKHVRITLDGTADEMTGEEIETAVIAFAAAALPGIRDGLTDEEKTSWDHDLEAIAALRAEAEERRTAEVEARPARVLSDATKRRQAAKGKVAEATAKIAENAVCEFGWRAEDMMRSAYLEVAFAEFIDALDAERNEAMTGDAVARYEEIVRIAGRYRQEMLRRVCRQQDWAGGSSPARVLDNVAKSKAQAAFGEWLESVINEANYYANRPRIDAAFGW